MNIIFVQVACNIKPMKVLNQDNSLTSFLVKVHFGTQGSGTGALPILDKSTNHKAIAPPVNKKSGAPIPGFSKKELSTPSLLNSGINL